jgi:hypothetical protein
MSLGIFKKKWDKLQINSKLIVIKKSRKIKKRNLNLNPNFRNKVGQDGRET